MTYIGFKKAALGRESEGGGGEVEEIPSAYQSVYLVLHAPSLWEAIEKQEGNGCACVCEYGGGCSPRDGTENEGKEEAKLYSSSACFFFHQCIAESEKSTNRILQK